MTRINAGIPVKSLTDEHLLAEHREIKRMCVYVEKSSGTGIPETFRLGTGHVKFFSDKMQYVSERYSAILKECQKREFLVTDYSRNFELCRTGHPESFGRYEPSKKDAEIVRERIKERILAGKPGFYHYYSERISRECAIRLLNYIIGS